MTTKLDDGYKRIVSKALNSPFRQTRNALTQSYFGEMLQFDSLTKGEFPILLSRKLYPRGVIGELASFLQGASTVAQFKANGCNYWDAWGDENGDLNLDYGTSWLDFNGVNQLANVVKSLKEDPMSRRHLISAWRPDRLEGLSLHCCHYSYQWNVTVDGELEMLWVQRSVDLMIGLPADIILAAVFNLLMAQTVGLKPGKITMHLGDCHVYTSHANNAASLLDRSIFGTAPKYNLDPDATVFNFTPDMLEITEYNPCDPLDFKLLT